MGIENVAIIGGGSSAHILVSLLGNDFSIKILTSRPAEWSKVVKTEFCNAENVCGKSICGNLQLASAIPSDVVSDADYIILCMPVHQYRHALNTIAPFVCRKKPVTIGFMYGQAGVNWMVREIITKYAFDNLRYFSFGLLPWIARTREYGHTGLNYGCKLTNFVAVEPYDYFAELNQKLLIRICHSAFGVGECLQSDNFISLTLSVDNQIIHPSRCYSLYRQSGGYWRNSEDIPYFYRDYDDFSADNLQQLDSDYSSIRNAIMRKFPERKFNCMLDYLSLEHATYHSSSADIKSSFTCSSTLAAIKPPVVQASDGRWLLNYRHRFFKDDFSYGICIGKWFAEKLCLQTPMIDQLLLWAQEIKIGHFLDDHMRLDIKGYLANDRFGIGTPNVYDIYEWDDLLL